MRTGLRSVAASGQYDPAGPYASTYASGTDTGYLVGVAYEKPEIALRVALTYASQTEFALDGTVGDGLPADNLAPTDGFFSMGPGGTCTCDNMKVTGGVRYVTIGDAVTEASGPGGSVFKGNSAFGVGVKVSFSF